VVGLIAASRKIIVLTGAGVSVSCGIPDFRSRDGVYARLAVDFPDLPDPQAMFDINYFRKDPRPFFKFAREIYPGQFKPSPCHRFIRSIEKHGKLLRNYTQNIDTLEQVAGIERAVQCHGSFATATCTLCKYKVQADQIKDDIFQQRIPYCPKCEVYSSSEDLSEGGQQAATSSSPPSSLISPESSSAAGIMTSHDSSVASVGRQLSSVGKSRRGIMKPDIVFFGEGLGDEFHKSVAIDKHEADLLIMIGSSLKVRPVALIPSSLSPEVPQILINREPLNHLTPDVELLGDCDGIVNQICLALGQGWEEPVHKPLKLTQTQELEPLDNSEPDIDHLLGTSICTAKQEQSGGSLDGEPQPSTSKGIEPAMTMGEEERQRRLMAALWKPRKSIASQLKENSYYFKPPSRYIFPGAEVYDRSDDEDDENDNKDSDSSSSDSSSSAGEDSDDEGSSVEVPDNSTNPHSVEDGAKPTVNSKGVDHNPAGASSNPVGASHNAPGAKSVPAGDNVKILTDRHTPGGASHNSQGATIYDSPGEASSPAAAATHNTPGATLNTPGATLNSAGAKSDVEMGDVGKCATDSLKLAGPILNSTAATLEANPVGASLNSGRGALNCAGTAVVSAGAKLSSLGNCAMNETSAKPAGSMSLPFPEISSQSEKMPPDVNSTCHSKQLISTEGTPDAKATSQQPELLK